MKIINITESPNFNAGKVHVYSDFDETYCPAKHSLLHIEGQETFMKDYCLKMNKFFESTEGDLHFHITTGRTFGEYEAISNLLKMRKFYLPLPESFIAKNGSDEYVKAGKNSDFYEKGIFPYKYDEPNKIKEQKIKKLTNWNGIELKTFIRNLTDKYNFRMVEADSENSVKDYGANSLYSEGKLNPDEWKKLTDQNGKIIEHDIPIAEYVLGARKDGNLKINLIFPPDYGYCLKRNLIYDSFIDEIKNFLRDKSVKYDIQWDIPNKMNQFNTHCNITPKIEDKPLTKMYDIKNAFREVSKNNDILIVAGDGSNDFDMLNPLEYIEQEEWNRYKKNSSHKEFYEKDMQLKLYDIKDALSGKNDKLKKELENNGLLKQIKEMPLYSIIIKKKDSKLSILRDVFGQFGKVVEIENSELDTGIKDIIKQHSKQHKIFKEGMSDKFKKYIFREKQKNTKNLIIGGVLAVLSGSLAFLIHKKYLNKKNENITHSK